MDKVGGHPQTQKIMKEKKIQLCHTRETETLSNGTEHDLLTKPAPQERTYGTFKMRGSTDVDNETNVAPRQQNNKASCTDISSSTTNVCQLDAMKLRKCLTADVLFIFNS